MAKNKPHDVCISLRSPCFNKKCPELKERKLREKRKKWLESKLEERWDWICTEIGFDKKGFEIQDGIREFVKWKLEWEGLK